PRAEGPHGLPARVRGARVPPSREGRPRRRGGRSEAVRGDVEDAGHVQAGLAAFADHDDRRREGLTSPRRREGLIRSSVRMLKGTSGRWRLLIVALAAVGLAGCPQKPKPDLAAIADAGTSAKNAMPPVSEPSGDPAHGKELVLSFQCN